MSFWTSDGRGRVQSLLNLSNSSWNFATSCVCYVADISRTHYNVLLHRYAIDSSLSEFTNSIKAGSRKVKEIVNIRLYINLERFETVMQEVRQQVLWEQKRDLLLRELNSPIKSIKTFEHRYNHYHTLHGNPKYEILRPLVWELVKRGGLDLPTVSEDMKLLRKWNQRVNETKLVEKIGKPDQWNLYDPVTADLQSQWKTEMKRLCPTKEYKHASPASDLLDVCSKEDKLESDMMAKNKRPDNSSRFAKLKNEIGDNSIENAVETIIPSGETSRHKKKSMFHPIKRLLRGSKPDKTRSVNERLDPASAVENNLRSLNQIIKDDRTYATPDLREQPFDEPSVPSRRQPITNGSRFGGNFADGTGDADDGLMIQVPGNVQKIVLVKDGRRITIET